MRDGKLEGNEIMTLNLICRVFNSEEFRRLFTKSQIYYVKRPKLNSDIKKGMKLDEMVDLIEEKHAEVAEIKKRKKARGKKVAVHDLPEVRTFQELVAYFISDVDIDTKTLEELSANYIDNMYKNGELTNRGTHSVVVAISNALLAKKSMLTKSNILLCFAMGLSHDIGHTPFGHEGEEVISHAIKELTGKEFSHEKNGVLKLSRLLIKNKEEHRREVNEALEKRSRRYLFADELTRTTNEEKYIKRKQDIDYGQMCSRLLASVVSHSTKRMKKEKFEGKYTNNDLADFSRASDKIAYSVTDINDIIQKEGIDHEEVKQMIILETHEMLTEYERKCRERGRGGGDISRTTITEYVDDLLDLSLGNQITAIIRGTHRTEKGVFINPYIWRIAKAERRIVDELRDEGHLDKGKGLDMQGRVEKVVYFVWKDIYHSIVTSRKQNGEKASEKEMYGIIDETNEQICKYGDQELVLKMRQIMSRVDVEKHKDKNALSVLFKEPDRDEER